MAWPPTGTLADAETAHHVRTTWRADPSLAVERLSSERRCPMPYFTDIQDLYDIAIDLFARLSEDRNIKKKALDSKLIVRFVYRDPAGELWIDCTGDDIKVLPGPQELTPDATLTMDSDVAHMFWLGKLNLIKSLSSKEIESEGSIPRMLKMLPVIKPAFNIYPEILKEKGFESLINVG
jgi:hypothetical protein